MCWRLRSCAEFGSLAFNKIKSFWAVNPKCWIPSILVEIRAEKVIIWTLSKISSVTSRKSFQRWVVVVHFKLHTAGHTWGRNAIVKNSICDWVESSGGISIKCNNEAELRQPHTKASQQNCCNAVVTTAWGEVVLKERTGVNSADTSH